MKANKGFTLMEVMIVVAIVGILASVALPAYNDYLMRGRLAEAHGELAAMRSKIETYFLDNRTYIGACAVGTVAPLPTGANLRFTYTCPTLTGTTYTVQAAGVAAQGTGGFTYTVDQANARATTSVPSGWTANATCWVTKKGGTC